MEDFLLSAIFVEQRKRLQVIVGGIMKIRELAGVSSFIFSFFYFYFSVYLREQWEIIGKRNLHRTGSFSVRRK
jgi:hypothetical protein